MLNLTTFPTYADLQQYADSVPDYMRPNHIPVAAIMEGFLSSVECAEIKEQLEVFEPYKSKKCGAMTRECGHVPVLDSIKHLALTANEMFWNYDLDVPTMSWMQTYSEGEDYLLHMDGAASTMRKLTAVAFLTDGKEYDDGDLEIYYHPESKLIPRTQGTVVIFQPWILHRVFPVTRGIRQSVNMGFWGPNFR